MIYASCSGRISFAAHPLEVLQIVGNVSGPFPFEAVNRFSHAVQIVGNFRGSFATLSPLPTLQYLSVEGGLTGPLPADWKFPEGLLVLDLCKKPTDGRHSGRNW